MAKRVPPEAGRRAETSPGGADDRALLALVAEGDARAFRSLVERHAGMALAVARRMLSNDSEAEDVAQEALIRLWRSGSELEMGPGGLRPWLRRVVSNLCIDRLRSARRLVLVDQLPEDAEPANHVRPVEVNEVSRRVDTALKTLPERQRLALTLFHFEGLSQAEIGGLMGLSDEAVESLLARARRGLKGELREEWRELLADEAG